MFLELTTRKGFEIDSDFIRAVSIEFSLLSFPLFAKINLEKPHTWIGQSEIDLNNFLSQYEITCVGAKIWNWSAHRALKKQKNEENNGINYVRIIIKRPGAHFMHSFPSGSMWRMRRFSAFRIFIMSWWNSLQTISNGPCRFGNAFLVIIVNYPFDYIFRINSFTYIFCTIYSPSEFIRVLNTENLQCSNGQHWKYQNQQIIGNCHFWHQFIASTPGSILEHNCTLEHHESLISQRSLVSVNYRTFQSFTMKVVETLRVPWKFSRNAMGVTQPVQGKIGFQYARVTQRSRRIRLKCTIKIDQRNYVKTSQEKE